MVLKAVLAVLFGIFGPSALVAGTQACLQAAVVAAAKHQVPEALLVTIARAESGRGPDRLPWPWTVNAAGRGQHFATKTAALEALRERRQKGETNLDIGCFQLNFRWHSHAFASLDEMFDPARNADHAARFLRNLFDETGDWKSAAGAYHSRTGPLAETYVARLERIFTGSIPAQRPTKPEPMADPQSSSAPFNLMNARPPLVVTPIRPLVGAGA